MKTEQKTGANNIAPKQGKLSTSEKVEVKTEVELYETTEQTKRGRVTIFWSRLVYINVNGYVLRRGSTLFRIPKETDAEFEVRRKAVAHIFSEREAVRALKARELEERKAKKYSDTVGKLLKHIGKLGL